MADNIDDFLRRAAERRQNREQQQRLPQQNPVQQNVPPPPPRTTGRSSPSAPRDSQRSASNKQRVNQQTKKLSNIQPQQRLASQIEESDNKMDARLQKVFDHKLGQFNVQESGSQGTATYSPKPDTKVVSAVEEGSLAKEVAAMFRDPATAKVAYVASEIFQRRF